MSRVLDLAQTIESALEIGSRALTGLRRLRFRNSAGTIDLDATPTGSHTVTLSAFSGDALVRSASGAIQPSSLAVPALDGSTGGRLSLGYGGNSAPLPDGNSTWTLQTSGSEFRLARRNSSGASLVPFAVTEGGVNGFGVVILDSLSTGRNQLFFRRGGSARWVLDRDEGIESGSNTSSNLRIGRYDDAGTFIDFAVNINRASGLTTLVGLLVNAAPTIGPINTSGSRSIALTNNVGTATLTVTPTANRTLTLPDNSGRITLTKIVDVTASKTFNLTDTDSIQSCSHSAACILTLPTNAAAPFEIGTTIRIVNLAPAQRLTLAPGTVELINQANLPQAGSDVVFLPAQAECQLLKVAANTWILSLLEASPRLFQSWYSDCLSLAEGGITAAGAGTGNGLTALAPETNAQGILSLTPGNQATGRYALYTAATGLSNSTSRRLFFSARAQISANANATDDFVVYLGFANSITAAPADGIFFRHSTANSGNWQAVCVASGVETVINTSLSATAYRTLGFLVARDNSVEFFEDGTSLGSISTNIPNGDTQPFGLTLQIRKTAGTSSRALRIDKYHAVMDI